jgi:hypothetical protein
MNTAEKLFVDLNEQVVLASTFRDNFEFFWKKEVSKRALVSTTYLICHTSLISCFENLLFLFCSREIWTYGGLGARAVDKGVCGPLYPLSQGDTIDKMTALCLEHQKEMLEILALLDMPAEKNFLENEIRNITKINALAIENLNSVYPNAF